MKYKKLFIVGCPRSGTTWVHSIFWRHPMVITSEIESRAYPFLVAPFLSEGLKEDDGWKFILNKYQKVAKNIEKSKESPDIWISTAGKTARWVSYNNLTKFIKNVRKIKEISDIEKAEIVINSVFDNFFYSRSKLKNELFVEKTPCHMNYAEMILKRYPEAKMIEVIRDGRDVCVSLELRGKVLKFFPKEREKQIDLWLSHIRKGERLKKDKRFTGRIITVRYEDLKQQPKKEIGKMFKFTGIDDSRKIVAEISEDSDFKYLKDTGPGKHFGRGVTGSWKKYFSAKDIMLFKKRANDILLKLGYN